MLVMKFGGTSVANAERLLHAAGLVRSARRPVVVVTSALGGVTDELIAVGDAARDGAAGAAERGLASIGQRHREAAAAIAATRPAGACCATARLVDDLLEELGRLVHGIGLVRECSARSSDLLVSFGERLAAPLLAAAIADGDVAATAMDARELIATGAANGASGPPVELAESRERCRAALLPLAARSVPVVTGFIARGPDGATTTLGRGGSDYTATLVGAFLDAREIWIWTDVDGVMTADPRLVAEARVLPAVTYREAAERAYFGSKVLHPQSMIPAVRQRIPVVIRNTFNPEHPGTRITDEPTPSTLGVKTVTAVPDMALVTVEGNGMIGVPGVMKRIFSTTAELDANVYMVSQASSEHNISFLVRRGDGDRVERALESEFERERARGRIDRIDVAEPVAILAAIGEGMRGRPGVSQRMFTALGRGRINVLAIAQGSSELNVSTVVHESDLHRAVGAVHSRFGLTRDTHLLVMGRGLVGRTLLRQIADARTRLAERHGIGLPVIGVCGRDEQLLRPEGLDEPTLRAIAGGTSLRELGGEARQDDATLLDRVAGSRWLDVVVVDATAADTAQTHLAALEHGFHVVTANKRPVAGPLPVYGRIVETAAAHGLGYLFETTFGAGLPALSTLQELTATCDEVRRVTGCLSGTLGVVCTALQAGQTLSAAVRDARDRGFTEPDPREDLSGADVARKALIIARQLGAELDLADVELEPLVPDAMLAETDVERFLDGLAGHDGAMTGRVEAAAARGAVLRYVADIAPPKVRVGLAEVAASTPAGQLAGPDNILIFETDRYRELPLVIRGPGAGAEVTAAGVLGDILKVVRAT
ncbi:MAG: bifunctional aspartate kinase/homoserine dehydrogenase I [Planctomycetota bacterium]|jgi:aspartokinase/homoserine dehydrogenase 1